MKLDKAIEILRSLSKGRYEGGREDARDAEKLGVEALKARKREKEDGYIDLDDLLPGEDRP
ncbi:hypothetical protein ES703_119579 [subsurface metagenome]